MYINNVTVFRLREFFKTLFNHRVIIRNLQEEKRQIEENAKDIFNMLSRAGCRMVIGKDEKSFLNTIMITNGEITAYIKSEVLIPLKYRIEGMIAEMKKFILKGKEGDKIVKVNTKGQTNNKKK